VTGRASPWFEEYWTPLGSFGQAPLDGDQIYFWTAAHVAGAAEAVSRRDLAAFRQEWRRVLPAAADLLERVSSFDDLLINTVRRVDCRRWFSGRLVLLGDAAHAMAPNLGAGANSALVDGVVLAEELAGARSVATRLAGADDGRDAPAPVWHRASHDPAPKRRSAGGIGPVPAAQRGGHPSRPRRRRPNYQIGIPARRALSPPGRRQDRKRTATDACVTSVREDE
jgi:hypothetical protein